MTGLTVSAAPDCQCGLAERPFPEGDGLAGIEMLASPSVLLEHGGAVLFVNRPGQLLLAATAAVHVAKGQLVARRATEQAALQNAIHAAFGIGAAIGLSVGQWPGIVPFADRQGVVVLTAFLRPWTEGSGQRRPCVLVSFVDWRRPRQLDSSLLVRGLSLTPMQASVLVLLADGKDLPAIAEMTGLALETVRRHIKRASARLGVHSQAQIVARLQLFLELR